MSRQDVATSQGWPRTRVELIESGRVRVERHVATSLADLYGVSGSARDQIVRLADEGSKPVEEDALAWITSHSFRKTNATILDDAGLSARQIADQLGHARPSLTMDVYMGRGASNRAAAAALDRALTGEASDPTADLSADTSRARPKGPGS